MNMFYSPTDSHQSSLLTVPIEAGNEQECRNFSFAFRIRVFVTILRLAKPVKRHPGPFNLTLVA